jgi:hypothetical protein
MTLKEIAESTGLTILQAEQRDALQAGINANRICDLPAANKHMDRYEACHKRITELNPN